jgi:hypothetical protein
VEHPGPSPPGRNESNTGDYAVDATAQASEHPACFVSVLGLGEQGAAVDDDGVGSKHDGVRRGRSNGKGLRPREAPGLCRCP